MGKTVRMGAGSAWWGDCVGPAARYKANLAISAANEANGTYVEGSFHGQRPLNSAV
jgi:hypothetical protein